MNQKSKSINLIYTLAGWLENRRRVSYRSTAQTEDGKPRWLRYVGVAMDTFAANTRDLEASQCPPLGLFLQGIPKPKSYNGALAFTGQLTLN